MKRSNRIRTHQKSVLLCAFTLFISGPLTHGQTLADESPDKQATSAVDQWRQAFLSYTVQIGSKQPTLQTTPILSWSNAQNFDQTGATFVWTLDERPVLIASAFNYRIRDRNRTKHTFHSLSKVPITVSDESGEFWHTKGPGLDWVRHELPVAPSRNRDMQSFRRIAREFELDMRSHRDQTSRLRLMSSPIYQYQNDSVSGAIFAFASGTDPDALLLVESHFDAEKPANVYGFARSHYYSLKAKKRGELAWEVDLDLEQQVQYLQFARRPLTANYISLIVEEKPAEE